MFGGNRRKKNHVSRASLIIYIYFPFDWIYDAFLVKVIFKNLFV